MSDLPLREPGIDAAGPGAELTALMTAARTGSREPFDRITEQVRGRAFRVAHSLVGSREDAMEMVQDALMKTWRARDTFREGEPFLPWFHRILRNTCYSFLRKRGRLRAASLSGGEADDGEATEWEIAEESDPPEAGLEREERADALGQALAGLAARDREILVLRHFQELAYQDIADTLEIPVGTVMSRLFHARRRLREKLGGEEFALE